MGQNAIKSIVKAECPHCKKPLFVPFTFMAPSMSAPLSEDDVKQAKAAARETINDSKKLTESEKKEAIKALNEPDTIFGMEDVGTITESFIN
jgi:hypothetical protein